MENIYEMLGISEFSNTHDITISVIGFLNKKISVHEWRKVYKDYREILLYGLDVYDKKNLSLDDFSKKKENCELYYNSSKPVRKLNDEEKVRIGKYGVIKTGIFYGKILTSAISLAIRKSIKGNLEDKIDDVKYSFKRFKSGHDERGNDIIIDMDNSETVLLSKLLTAMMSEDDPSITFADANGYTVHSKDGTIRVENGVKRIEKLLFDYYKEPGDDNIEIICKKLRINMDDLDDINIKYGDYTDIEVGHPIIITVSGKSIESGLKYNYSHKVIKNLICEFKTDDSFRNIREDIVPYILEQYPGFKEGNEYNNNYMYINLEEHLAHEIAWDNKDLTVMQRSPVDGTFGTYKIYFHGTREEYDNLVAKGLFPESEGYSVHK